MTNTPTSVARPGSRFANALKKHRQDDEAILAGNWADALLADALDARASDVHLDPRDGEVAVRFRIDGVLIDIELLDRETGPRLIRYFKTNSGLDPATRIGPEDAHFEFGVEDRAVDVRVACAPCLTGEKLTLRLLPRTRIEMGLDALGLADADLEKIKEWLGDISGMFLVTGPTGSGKTSTLHALLNEMALTNRSVITIEDPVEYRAEGVNQIEVDETRELTFATGLRAVLRLDPDYILLGEIRDAESAATGLEAAGTGHPILTTMHSRSAAGAISMLRNLGLADHEIATSLAFVIAQRLVRTLCPECKREVTPCEADARWLRRMGVADRDRVWEAKGCERCHGAGYLGRVGVFEVWPFDERSYDLVLKGGDEQAIRAHLRESGVRSLLQDGLEKAARGLTTISELRNLGAQSHLEQIEPGTTSQKSS